MRKRLSSLVASGLIAAGIAVTGVQPASAGVVGPAGTMKPVAAANAAAENVVEVGQRYRRHHRRHHWSRHHRSPRAGISFHFGTPRHYPRYVYPRHVYPRHVYPRHVYPRYQNRRVYRSSRGLPSAHVRWCDNRYISYRAWDNTFQPYHGPRKQCRSPYY